ncbi:MAG: LytR C-terminal domain-containing protein [Sporichthyaceae bacterium]|nr:LytR C-terminal domain-containing protein [Sporichthyaceae bacterium]
MSGQDQYGDYDYTRRSSGGEYEGQQDYNGRGGDQGQYGGRTGARARRTEAGYGRGADTGAAGTGAAGTYGARGEQQQAGEYGQPAEYGNREYRSYRRGEYRPRSDYSRTGEQYAARGGYGRRGQTDLIGGGGEPPRTRRDVIGVIASSLFAVLAVLALVAVIYIVISGRGTDDSPTTAPTSTGSGEPTSDGSPSGEPNEPAEKAPVVVLNSTDRAGLAKSVSDEIKAEEWEIGGEPANYGGNALATTTVFYPEGMQGSAELLQEAFPDIGDVQPAESGMSDTALTVVVGEDWPE